MGPVRPLEKLAAHAKAEGLSATPLYLRGKIHNPENRDLCKEFFKLCDRTPELQLPSSADLVVPIRSNKTGQKLSGVSLSHEVIDITLVSRCEWFDLMIAMSDAFQRTGESAHIFLLFGTGRKNCIPSIPFDKKQLSITKLDVLTCVEPLKIQADGPSLDSFPSNAIAVVGAACRLPGANSMDELWDLVSAGRSRAEELRLDRVDPKLVPRTTPDGKNRGMERKWYGNFIDDVDAFDNAFFHVSPRESTYMDPQQRLLLETAYEALDSSGYLRSHRREDFDNVGCFLGSTYVEYQENTNGYNPTAYTATGTIRAFQSGKISYYFGWSGPSEVIDTACSSSLVAVHRACSAIQTGECPMALAGGVNLITGIHNFLDLGKAGFLSSTGQCKPFDVTGDGYCRADGVGLVVLKSLTRAIADGDDVLGVIPGVATNHGGLSPSITVPYSRAQTALFKTVLNKSRIKPSQVSYVEAHGTGTQVGDPIEMGSIREVLGGSQRSDPLYLGSLKANVGHSETAAGIGSLIKVLAMLQKEQIPPLVGFKTLNPKIPALEPDHLRIPTQVTPWKAPFRAALVNSYGAAGSNSALMCCEGPRRSNIVPPHDSGLDYPIFLSAASIKSLKLYAVKLAAYVRNASHGKEARIGDLALTLHERRKHHSIRWVGTARDAASLTQSLESDMDKIFETPPAAKPVVLIFSGQSKHNVRIDQSWCRLFPCFRNYLHQCNEIVKNLGHPEIIPAVFQSDPISNIVVLQCSTFAVQYSCAKCWMDSGLQVDAVVGHSFGELTAMAVSGILSIEDGLRLVASRASLMEIKWGSERGTMLAIHASVEMVSQIVDATNTGNSSTGIEIACFNSPKSQVVVGSESSIKRAEKIMGDDSRFRAIKCQRLNVTHGFHSVFTESILDDLDITAKSLIYNNPMVPLESCTQHHLDPVTSDRIVQHTRTPVYFTDALARLEQRLGPCIWLEAGTDSPIIPMAKKAVQAASKHVFVGMKTTDSKNAISTATAALWREGISTSFWGFLSPKESGLRPIWLPPYQFERSRYWLKYVDPLAEERKLSEKDAMNNEVPIIPSKLVTPRRRASDSWASLEFDIHADTNRFTDVVSSHSVRGQPLCPASMYMESVVMAAQMIEPSISVKAFKFQNMLFQGALGINYEREVSLVLEGAGEYLAWNYTVRSAPKHDAKPRSIVHARGKFSVVSQVDFGLYERVMVDHIQKLLANPRAEKLMAGRAYALFSRVVNYSEALRGISHISILDNQAVAEIKRPNTPVSSTESSAVQICDMVALDTFIQVVGLLINSSDDCPEDEVFIATGIDSIVMQDCDFSQHDSWTVYAMSSSGGDPSKVAGDMMVFTKDGKLILTGSGVQFTRYPIKKLEKLLQGKNINPLSKASKQVSFPVTQDLKEESKHIGIKPKIDRQDYDEQTLVATDNLSTISHRSTKTKAYGALRQLGLDSLAATQLAGRLQSSHVNKDLDKQLNFLLRETTDNQTIRDDKTDSTNESSPQRNFLDGKNSKAIDQGQNIRDRQRILELISENSGGSGNSITDSTSLEYIGIDSLSVVELKASLEDAFGREFEHLDLQSTVKEMMDYVNYSPSYIQVAS